MVTRRMPATGRPLPFQNAELLNHPSHRPSRNSSFSTLPMALRLGGARLLIQASSSAASSIALA